MTSSLSPIDVDRATYTSAYSPASPSRSRPPSTPPRVARRSRSPRRTYPHASTPARTTYRLPHALSSLLTPRILSPLILWSLAVYLIHNYLVPLPVPSLPVRRPRPASSSYFLSKSFPPPPNRAGDDSLDSVDPRYRPLKPLGPPDSPFPRLRPTRILPPRCLEQWFADGETSCGAAEMGEEEKLDATWLWVNGSDPRWREDMVRARKEARVYSAEHHFR